MSEWQPVRIAPVEAVEAIHSGIRYVWMRDENLSAQGKIVRVRQVRHAEVPPGILALRPKAGCDAKSFYLVHPEDISSVVGTGFDPNGRLWLCEHQILAD